MDYATLAVLKCRAAGVSAIIFLFLLLLAGRGADAQPLIPRVTVRELGSGWAANSVNAVIFRKNAVVSQGNIQYASWYDEDGYVILAKRNLPDGSWKMKRSNFKGNVKDAHNAISIMADGDGFLHLSWDHHNNPLNYARNLAPGSLDLGPRLPMLGELEQRVSYPEFYRMPDGSLLFFYRNGGSGRGDLVINRYDLRTRRWRRLHNSLIDGQGVRNAYAQTFVDKSGVIHISWVWRESPDVASNHDMCYARSSDGGLTWQRSDGRTYDLPITAESAEYALHIPPGSQLINQTSISADKRGNPYIISYWQAKDRPQYQLIYKDGTWKTLELDFRKGSFSLSGMGTKSIPISRPQILIREKGASKEIIILFRDRERGSKASACIVDLASRSWKLCDLWDGDLGDWEPNYDTERWKDKQVLSLFLQAVEQKDGEGISSSSGKKVKILDWKP